MVFIDMYVRKTPLQINCYLHVHMFVPATGAVHRCFEQKKKNGEEAIVVQKNTTLKAIADWLRYAAARVKKTVSATDSILA